MTDIIVLCHNSLSITQQFLTHLFDNTTDFFLVLINNGSTDGTKDYLDQFKQSHLNMLVVHNEENLGVIGGRNQGYEITKTLPNRSPYLCFLDNDQMVLSGWLEHHYKFLIHKDLVGVEAWTMTNSFNPLYQNKKVIQPFSYVGCGGMLMKIAVPDKVGMFDPQFNPCYFEDPDFNFRVFDASFGIAWNYAPKLIHLPHSTLGLNPQKLKRFEESRTKFRNKWKGRKVPRIFQYRLEDIL